MFKPPRYLYINYDIKLQWGIGINSDSRLNILLAEDDPASQKVALAMLKRLGYKADAVTNGREVLQALEHQTYDLVLMDLAMPEMDGITDTREIRRRYPDSKQPRIVAFTAYTHPDICKIYFEVGMDDCILKPATISTLADVLDRHHT